MEQSYGYAGKILRVNLSENYIGCENETQTLLRKYLGGVGLGIKILYDEVDKRVRWSDPENLLILSSGPLGGLVKGSGNFSVVTKGALTEGGTSTQANGYFGAYLRFAGFDSIVVTGKAEKLSYLFIDEGKAELKDASHLSGRDTWQTEELIKKELGFSRQEMSVFSIGPAGENLVRFAALVGDCGHVAGHNGVGAVMGAKNLKAIAIARTKNRINVYDKHQLSELSSKMLELIKNDLAWASNYRWGTLTLFERLIPAGTLPFNNYTISECPLSKEQITSFEAKFLREKLTFIRHHPCWACQMHHCDIIQIPEGPFEGLEGEEPEYEGYAAMGPQIGNYDGIVATSLSNEVDRLGMDVNETSWVLGMIMEGYEKKLLCKKDTDGLEMTWGNIQATRAMLHKIAHRQGIGEVLAEGVIRASMTIGKGLPDLAIYSKNGSTPISHDHRRNWAYILDICTSDIGTSETHCPSRPACIGITEPRPYFHNEIATYIAQTRGVTPFIDGLGVCRQANREVPELLCGMLNAATGWDFTWEEAIQVGMRIVNLLRAFNICSGYKPEKEVPSLRYGSVPSDGPGKGKDIAPIWSEMVDIYYREMGWDRATGKPLPSTLQKLDLASIIDDLWTKNS